MLRPIPSGICLAKAAGYVHGQVLNGMSQAEVDAPASPSGCYAMRAPEWAMFVLSRRLTRPMGGCECDFAGGRTRSAKDGGGIADQCEGDTGESGEGSGIFAGFGGCAEEMTEDGGGGSYPSLVTLREWFRATIFHHIFTHCGIKPRLFGVFCGSFISSYAIHSNAS